MCLAPVLKLFNRKPPTPITIDASNYAIGAIMEQSEIEQTHPVSFLSRTFRESEYSYSAHDKRLIAMVYLIRALYPHLHEKFFVDYDSHYPVKFLKAQPHHSLTQGSWLETLVQLDFKITPISGMSNIAAYALFRLP